MASRFTAVHGRKPLGCRAHMGPITAHCPPDVKMVVFPPWKVSFSHTLLTQGTPSLMSTSCLLSPRRPFMSPWDWVLLLYTLTAIERRCRLMIPIIYSIPDAELLILTPNCVLDISTGTAHRNFKLSTYKTESIMSTCRTRATYTDTHRTTWLTVEKLTGREVAEHSDPLNSPSPHGGRRR